MKLVVPEGHTAFELGKGWQYLGQGIDLRLAPETASSAISTFANSVKKRGHWYLLDDDSLVRLR